MNVRAHSLAWPVLLALFFSLLTPLRAAEPPEDPERPRAVWAHYLEGKALELEIPRISIDDMERNTGLKQRSYRLSQIMQYVEDRVSVSKTKSLEEEMKASGYKGPKKFPWVHLRRSFSDVLASEDPTLNVPGDKTFDDVEGALFTFARDFSAGVDTWSSQAALIAPFSFDTGITTRQGDGLHLVRWGIIPSASLFRISTTGDPAEEVDLRTYRAGVFGKWETGVRAFTELTLRGFLAYTDDEQHESGTWAGEFELEPHADWHERVRLGYRTILIDKPEKWQEDKHDTALIAYQARLYLRGEYGSVNKEGELYTGPEFEYFRLGPVAQFDLKPFIFKRLNLSFRYQWLPTVSGEDVAEQTGSERADDLFQADATWLLIDPEERAKSRLGIKASYIYGGVGPLQEKTDTLLIGFDAAF